MIECGSGSLRQNQHRSPAKKVPLPYVKRLWRLMETGLSNKEIALKLHVSLATVKTHINNIYSKLQVRGRLQALECARTLDLF
ncbi:hypothetical protein GNP95_20470 [Paenibacillus woosongensis]|uniref:HTH luxR-type domain-containing protein n=2 Tax=Paenibacillus woosongensis TaxID=307580 RepID=A0A7X2Z4D0_9BACL|nr:hypothetical protein [Paenibacillus woosongensis]